MPSAPSTTDTKLMSLAALRVDDVIALRLEPEEEGPRDTVAVAAAIDAADPGREKEDDALAGPLLRCSPPPPDGGRALPGRGFSEAPVFLCTTAITRTGVPSCSVWNFTSVGRRRCTVGAAVVDCDCCSALLLLLLPPP